MKTCKLSEIKINKKYRIVDFNDDNLFVKEFDNIGITKGRQVMLTEVGVSDPMILKIADSRITLRKKLAKKIVVELIKD